MPVNNPYTILFSGSINQLSGVALSPPSAFGTAPSPSGSPATTEVANVNAAMIAVFSDPVPVLVAGQQTELQTDSTGSLFVNATGRLATYHAQQSAFVPLADPVVPFFVLQGSATKTIQLRHIKITWACTTGNSAPCVLRLKRYTVISGGTPNAVTIGPNDTLNPAATATLNQYSVLPSTATPFNAGALASEYMGWTTNAAGIVGPVPIQWDFGVNNAQALVLRGTSDYLGMEISAVAAGAPTMTVCWTFTES